MAPLFTPPADVEGGHETTAAMFTWTLFELAKADPGMFREIQREVRTVLKDKDRPDYDDVVKMKKMRYALIEGLRLYPEPPVLIRRARTEDELPQGSSALSPALRPSALPEPKLDPQDHPPTRSLIQSTAEPAALRRSSQPEPKPDPQYHPQLDP